MKMQASPTTPGRFWTQSSFPGWSRCFVPDDRAMEAIQPDLASQREDHANRETWQQLTNPNLKGLPKLNLPLDTSLTTPHVPLPTSYEPSLSPLTLSQRLATILLTSLMEDGHDGVHRFVPFDRISDAHQLADICQARWEDFLHGRKFVRVFFQIPCSSMDVWIEIQRGAAFDWTEFMRALCWAWHDLQPSPCEVLYVKLLLVPEESATHLNQEGGGYQRVITDRNTVA
ncbi:hypothetical protein PVAG01_11312 [Phlyctema vagabunda]|uniref:Uncharacterized protein n=1 Tax=Phlyctema vagabunda TaxID=108571 RepID=A0ABR4P1Z1_9HELO